ncbi:MAG TPA: RNA 2'-phosphotransferase [Mycobacteriales bacterium]|nr:RNA 2'-phosphotransferase [Mycobacteriales bacterium]
MNEPMDSRRLVRVSKYLSRHLRHQPERLGLTLRPGGWVAVDDLLAACAARGFAFSRDELDEVVRRNDKQRFGFDETRTMIRARQGHSTPVELHLPPATPPDVLFHGTGTTSVAAILATGLEPRGRHHVHLSADVETARRVGARHGRPVVLRVDAAAMQQAGCAFYVSDNGVWLVDGVPAGFLSVVE